jgi:hypothetical protein
MGPLWAAEETHKNRDLTQERSVEAHKNRDLTQERSVEARFAVLPFEGKAARKAVV